MELRDSPRRRGESTERRRGADSLRSKLVNSCFLSKIFYLREPLRPPRLIFLQRIEPRVTQGFGEVWLRLRRAALSLFSLRLRGEFPLPLSKDRPSLPFANEFRD